MQATERRGETRGGREGDGAVGAGSNPAREKGSCHALAALVSVCIRCLYYFHVFGILSLLRYLLEVVTFVAVIVVSMVCWSSAKMFINDDDSSVMKPVT